MPDKVKIGGKEYSLDDFNESGKAQLASLNFTLKKIKELENMQALLQRAKNSYIESLKTEVLASKTGFFVEEDWEVKMPKITLDGIEYNSEDLTDNGKAQLASLQFLEVQMGKLKSEIAVYQTARNSYLIALKNELEAEK